MQMKKLEIIAAIAALSGCAMTPAQKQFAGIAAGILVVGAIAAHDADNGNQIATNQSINPAGPPCTVQPDGSCR